MCRISHICSVFSELFIELISVNTKRAPKSVYQRGAEIFLSSSKDITIEEEFADDGNMAVSLMVPSQSFNSAYLVTFEHDEETKVFDYECDCPYGEENGICKHIVAAGMVLQQKYRSTQQTESGKIKDSEAISIDTAKIGEDYSFRIPLNKINTHFIDALTKPADKKVIANRKAKSGKIKIVEEDKRWSVNITLLNETRSVNFYSDGKNLVIERNEKSVDSHYLTIFEAAALQGTLNYFNWGYFQTLINYDEQKANLLAQYGVSPEDPEAKLFKFQRIFGRLQIEAPENFLKVNDNDQLGKWVSRLNIGTVETPSNSNAEEIYEVGLLFDFSRDTFCGMAFEPFKVIQQATKVTYKKLSLKTAAEQSQLRNFPPALQHDLLRLTEKNFEQLLGNRYYYLKTDPELVRQVQGFYYDFFEKHLDYLSDCGSMYKVDRGSRLGAKSTFPVKLSAQGFSIKFSLVIEGEMFSLNAFIVIGKKKAALKGGSLLAGFIAQDNGVLYLPESRAVLDVCNSFNKGGIKIHNSGIHNFLTQIVIPLSNKYQVDFPEGYVTEVCETITEKAVYLKELNEKFLLIQPAFKYGETLLEYDPGSSEHFTALNKTVLTRVIRQKSLENDFVKWMKTLHPDFKNQSTNSYFYVNFSQAMKNRWFIDFCHTLQEADVNVYGINDLKKFKYNVNKPVFEMKTGSGIDWFDIHIEVHFGKQTVGLKELRKAIVNHDPYILLDDGTIGVLPDEWFEKYSMLFKMGNVTREDSLQLSKFHFTVIDELYSQIDNEKVLAELADKREKLKNVSLNRSVKIPAMKNVKLRPYQESGFQWMNTLDDMQWGGCLADDMGLGKTLQTLTFIIHLIKKYPGSTHLIVCPTSLIFNWQNEIVKFAPKLNYHIYYGSERERGSDYFNQYDVVITSYGTLRNDIEHFNKFEFNYVILDESQAIKNPTAKLTKAVQLVKAKNKLLLSGTPVQNNTFDLYAQFNFLNPGMLGNLDFFKKEFANPIDRESNPEVARQLQKLIYPFMLRRIKEQVAKDLPARTEMIMYCVMGPEQRKIYDQFKEHYRKFLMDKIKEEGMGKSGIYILEGLTKLRQICDSPALLNEDKRYPNESAKLAELIREIEENVGQHKALVFSQFVGMLDLIRKQLEHRKIAYEYIDGSVTAQSRQTAVNNFQNNADVKVFLISLKAGGVGLNITAADYVYLVDPWWNPAVEQQAIDRTHRIGQTKKIFAYKMICKDSVEEKIIQLQEKKKAIAADIIKEENGFMKKLNKEDIEFLFS